MIENEQEFITNSFEETQRFGKKFAQRLRRGDIIALYGELGSGKTTFVQGLVRGLGITRRIMSPTFIIVRTYKLKLKAPRFVPLSGTSRGEQNSNVKNKTQNSKLFYHIDLYRIESENDVKGLGIEEILNDPQNIVVIEWAEKIRDLLPKKRWDIKFEYISDSKRKIYSTRVNQ